MILMLLMLSAASQPACIPVDGERIYTADLAREIPSLAALPSRTALGYAPAPGARRVIRAAELQRFFGPRGPQLPDTELCVERATQSLDRAGILDAMRAALGGRAASLEVVDWSHDLVPRGSLQFPLSGLRAAPHEVEPALWQGWVVTREGRRYPISAHVRISVESVRWVAQQELKAGIPILPQAVRTETVSTSLPLRSQALESAAVTGRVPRRTIAAGSAVQPDMLDAAPEVGTGETVRVEARSGSVVLKLEGISQTKGRRGDIVMVRTAWNGRHIRARVTGPGSAEAVGPVAGGPTATRLAATEPRP